MQVPPSNKYGIVGHITSLPLDFFTYKWDYNSICLEKLLAVNDIAMWVSIYKESIYNRVWPRAHAI